MVAIPVSRKKYHVKKSTLEWIGLIGVFLLSFVNSTTLLMFFIFLLFLLLQKEIGAIKIINIITLRSVVNNGIALEVSALQNVKWAILFGCAIYLLFSIRKMENAKLHKIKWVLLFFFVFVACNVITAFAFSSLPMVALMKLISYSLIFLGIFIGVGYTLDKYDWRRWLSKWFYLLFMGSIISLAFPSISYLVNGIWFQGVIGHPNMFGIVSVLFLALLLTNNLHDVDSRKCHMFFSVPLILLLVILSKSRTAFIACVVILLIYLLLKNGRKLTYLKATIFSFSLAMLVLYIPKIYPFVNEFLYKGQSPGDLLHSREQQISGLLYNFSQNPWFGTGFAVPWLPYKSYEFSMEYIVESGNLILAVLSYSGIIGFALFMMYMLHLLLANKRNFSANILLFLSAVLISAGEMVFFSSNSIGIFCYMYIALYVFLEKPKTAIN